MEVKNLNSFRSLRGAIEYEARHQPERWLGDGKEMGPGAKTTRGWDDARNETYVQREKEDAHDYRYFPDPDLVPVVMDEAWRESLRTRVPELPLARARRYASDFGLSAKEAAALVDERDVCVFYERTCAAAEAQGVEAGRAGKLAANFVLQSGAKRANERSTAEQAVLVSDLGISPEQVGAIAAMRHRGELSSNGADELFGLLCAGGGEHGSDAHEAAKRHGTSPWRVISLRLRRRTADTIASMRSFNSRQGCLTPSWKPSKEKGAGGEAGAFRATRNGVD